MEKKSLQILIVLCSSALISCSQNNQAVVTAEAIGPVEQVDAERKLSHNYGGWYCPDNLKGFPAVDINNWQDVPVVNGRMATKEETQNGSSLIFIENKEYPDAKPLDMTMPKLARYYSENTKREELVIVIQAIQVLEDSIVGFRYLNGGNGSAHLSEVTFLTDNQVKNLTPARFVSRVVEINAAQDKIWKVLTEPEFNEVLKPIYDKASTPQSYVRGKSKVNFKYLKEGNTIAEFAETLFGNKYIQIDYEVGNYQYTEKFLLLTNEETQKTELKIVCGPYGDDFESQQQILKAWGQKVKSLSEG